jgi:iron complex transport system substrate-binding protein
MREDFSPHRVAALQPSATDTLARLDLLERVVACTRYCAEVVPGVDAGRRVISDSWTASADELLAAHPDLVIASVPYQPEALAQILKAGVRFLGLAPKNLRDIYGDIAAIAGVMGVVECGAGVIATMQSAIEDVRRTAAGAARPRVFCEEWGKPIIPSEPWVAELVEIAGGMFLLAPGKAVEPEAVRAAAPEVIVFGWTGAGGRVPAAQLIAERGWQDTPAARDGRVYVVHDALLNTPGPAVVDGLRALAWAIHPELVTAAPRIRRALVV